MRVLAIVLFLAAVMLPALAQDAPDTSGMLFQEYFNRLIDDWRVQQVREFAQQWGVNVSGGKQFSVNRSFWEDRFNLSLSVGLPRGRQAQNLILEYQLGPTLLIRGEAAHQAARSDAWIDLIFRTEY
jgi:hypothetical protein